MLHQQVGVVTEEITVFVVRKHLWKSGSQTSHHFVRLLEVFEPAASKGALSERLLGKHSLRRLIVVLAEYGDTLNKLGGTQAVFEVFVCEAAVEFWRESGPHLFRQLVLLILNQIIDDVLLLLRVELVVGEHVELELLRRWFKPVVDWVNKWLATFLLIIGCLHNVFRLGSVISGARPIRSLVVVAVNLVEIVVKHRRFYLVSELHIASRNVARPVRRISFVVIEVFRNAA